MQLRRSRQAAALSLRQLANRVGYDHSYLSQVERGPPPRFHPPGPALRPRTGHGYGAHHRLPAEPPRGATTRRSGFTGGQGVLCAAAVHGGSVGGGCARGGSAWPDGVVRAAAGG
ncbi:helix-turn-helix domain-containing protein [Kribbella caucasensis]|uniref:helix-turn-helix domain-containing protein n=1 Tax=Kribbella caucasensis TaxID=2512215 RepID=UPI00105BC501